MNENNELLMYIYKNADMGVKSTTKLLKLLNNSDNKIKPIVEGELKGYENFLKKSKNELKKHKATPKGNTKIANCSLIVDENQVGSTQQISFVKKGTSASATFTGLNINPTSIIQISYAVNSGNNDAVTITNETITLTFAN